MLVPNFYENISKFVRFLRKTINTSSFAKKKPVDFDDELRIGDVRYDNMIKITFKVQLFLTFTIHGVLDFEFGRIKLSP